MSSAAGKAGALYHGTSQHLAASIGRDGLKRFSYLTDSAEAAEHYARRASCLYPRGETCSAAVLSLDVPEDAIDIDPTDSAHVIQQQRFPGSCQYMTARALASSRITAVRYFEVAVSVAQQKRVRRSIAFTRSAQPRFIPEGRDLSPQPSPQLESDVCVVLDYESRWKSEFGGTFFYYDEAWAWGPFDGYALFTRWPDCWQLDRVWIRPALRRRGLLSAAWPVWRERYGDFIERSESVYATEPASDGMQAFLAKVRDVPLATFGRPFLTKADVASGRSRVAPHA